MLTIFLDQNALKVNNKIKALSTGKTNKKTKKNHFKPLKIKNSLLNHKTLYRPGK